MVGEKLCEVDETTGVDPGAVKGDEQVQGKYCRRERTVVGPGLCVRRHKGRDKDETTATASDCADKHGPAPNSVHDPGAKDGSRQRHFSNQQAIP